MSITALIVDDEPLARQGVALRLKAHPDIEVVGECENGREGYEAILALKPNLVFLDIQMPLVNGIELARSIPAADRPFIIFLTAFDEYVMRAFELHAIDYLLKPVDEARFRASLDHARRVLGTQQNAHQIAYQQRLENLLKQETAPATPALREITIRNGRQVAFISVDDIDWIEAQGDYVEIHVGARTHLIRESLSVLEGRLDVSSFLRIHRSAIVRIQCIASVTALPNRGCSLKLRNGTKLRVSRTYSEHLRKLLRNQTL